MIEIVCHRGANEYAPENTYPAAAKCIDWGVDYVEIDVNTSRDGVMYLFHGPDLERTTNATGLFHDLASGAIDALDAGSWFAPEYAGERVPRLDGFLRWIKGKARVYFDVKRAEHGPLIALIRDIGLERECFFWTAHNDWVLELRERAPELPVKINVRNIADVQEAHRRFKADVVEIGLKNMSEDLRRVCCDLGIKLMIYHQQNDRDAFCKIIDWNVDMVNLNHADAFLDAAREMGVR